MIGGKFLLQRIELVGRVFWDGNVEMVHTGNSFVQLLDVGPGRIRSRCHWQALRFDEVGIVDHCFRRLFAEIRLANRASR